ncbi:MAG: DUF692 family protein [Proteobacteria bacterium]|nr:DUF692 family protein [Pseudomonadota bacterium]
MTAMDSAHPFPKLGFGLGLRGVHVPHILEHKPAVDWFEVISENYLDNEGRGKDLLEKVKADYPIVMHGVSMSIGTTDPINSDYLKKLRALAEWVKPAWISDHLCWTGVAHKNTHDLLPVPYTEEALAHIIDRIKAVQDFLGRRIVLENPSTYLEFKTSTIPEEDFIARMAEGSGCGLLLDVNNVYVSCYNHRKSAQRYIDALPLSHVAQIHLAGHTNKETHIVDTHDGPVIDDVWQLYRYAISKAGFISTMVEWDDNIPPFDVVNAELLKARAAAAAAHEYANLPDFSVAAPAYVSNIAVSLPAAQNRMLDAILKGNDTDPAQWIREKDSFNPQDQLNVYIHGYRLRLIEVTSQDYPVLRRYLGKAKMDTLLRDFVNAVPSSFYDAGKYPASLPAFMPKDDVFAHELAQLECVIAQMNFMPETKALSAEDLAHIEPDALMAMRLPVRSAFHVFSFRHDINAYYNAVNDSDDAPLPVQQPTYLAVYRHEGDVWRLALDADEYALLSTIAAGTPVGDAIDATGIDEATMSEKLPIWFSRWMRNGILARDDTASERIAA